MSKRPKRITAKTQKSRITNDAGLPGVVIHPEGADPQEGIPVHLDLDALYGHLPVEFRAKLYQALHERGLIEPADYLSPGADQRFKSAVLHVIKHDFFNVQQLAREALQ